MGRRGDLSFSLWRWSLTVPAANGTAAAGLEALLESLQDTFARERQIADRLADDMPQGIG
jgi:hypothetical protein